MPDSANYGISGGNITAQNLAVGPNSRIEQSNYSQSFANPLSDLARAIDAFDGPPQARDALMAVQTEIAGELEAPAPDKNRVLAKLATIKDLAGPTATVVQAAAVLAQAIATIL
jgi:hypothetical protein